MAASAAGASTARHPNSLAPPSSAGPRILGFVPYPNGIIAEVSVSAGALGDSFGTGRQGDEIEPYVTLNWLTQF